MTPRLTLQLIAGFAILLFLSAYVFPYFYLLSTSLKPAVDAITVPPTLLPEAFSLQNYLTVLANPGTLKSFSNSLIIALCSTLLSLVLSVPAAYGITRYSTVPGRLFLVLALCARMIPYISIGVPLFNFMKNLHLIDTHLAVILAHTTINLPLSIWLMCSFFEGFPTAIEEAARVDGCSRFGALIRVIVPVASGGIAVTAIFAFLTSWNEFLFSLLLTTVNAKTAPIAIAEFNTQYSVDWGAMAAMSILFSLPVMLFSFFMQKRIVSGLTMGAVKQ
ncbi:carbohydrate ABC transporter permease [Deinococcus roseus]|uniref:ABC transporter permease protein y4oR n=1 Tax=Deinococcus roseus TaxID=392414 RepID=A0ABQ2D531_9DEIO|nr:carbohydrate ABC transporter permease [Deinococcus roseus]GGJ43555.1 putative ABC transporter permease protein y4oR [Deinococcus roseus]